MPDDVGSTGWFPDPSNSRLERYHDGTKFTEYTRKAPRGRGPSGSGGGSASGGGTRTSVSVLIGFLVLGAGAVTWYLVKGGQDLANEESDLVTEAPAAANAAAYLADVRNLEIQVTTTVVDTGGALPTVAYQDGKYVVSDGTTPVTVGAAQGVTSAGITGSSGEVWCVWVKTADGQQYHAKAGGESGEQGC